jgi:hypothetical protein
MDVYEIINELRPNYSKFIFWNDDDIPMAINKSGAIQEWSGDIDNLNYYY